MANRYVRSGGGNYNAAGTWEETVGGGETVAVPTAADDVFCVATSGNLAITAAAVCRSFNQTGYTGTTSHGAFTLTVGTTTAPPSGIEVVLVGTYTAAGATSAITYASTDTSVTHTVDLGGKTVGTQTFSGTSTRQMQSNFTMYAATTAVTLTAGTLDFNGVTMTGGTFTTTGTTARTLTLGSATLALSSTAATAFAYTGSNLTITANTATVNFTGAGATFAGNGADWNGLTISRGNINGTLAITGANTFKKITVNTATAQTITFPQAATTTFTDTTTPIDIKSTLNSAPVTILASTGGGQATLSCASGTASFESVSLTNIVATGGATFNMKWVSAYTTSSGFTRLASPKYVRAGGGNSNAAATWSTTSGGAADASSPSKYEEVYLDASSGNFTLAAALNCNAFDMTGYAGTYTSGAFAINIGSEFAPTSNKALVLAGSYAAGLTTHTIIFNSTASGVHTIDWGGKQIGLATFQGTAEYQFTGNATQFSTGYFTHTNGTLDFGSVTVTGGGLNTSGTTARTIKFGTSKLNFNYTAGGWTYTGSGLTVDANTAVVTFSGASPTMASNGQDWNGLTVVLTGAAGTFAITGGATFKNFYVAQTTTKTITNAAGTTLTVTDDLAFQSSSVKPITINSDTAGVKTTISKPSGTAYLYSSTIKDIDFTGGATFIADVSAIDNGNNTGITFQNSPYYMCPETGSDTNDTPLGWWSVAYTNATGAMPALDATVTGATSNKTAKITFVNQYEWNYLKAGTMYFYGRSGAFVSETVNVGASSFDIAGDLSVACWKTIPLGSTAARIVIGDNVRLSKSDTPVSLGEATWTSDAPVGVAIASSTNASPIVITSNGHPFTTGQYIRIAGHATNTMANGFFKVGTTATNTLQLLKLDGTNTTGNGTGSGSGTITLANNSIVELETATTEIIDNVDEVWTANATGDLTSGTIVKTAQSVDGKTGASCVKFTLDAAVQTSKMQAYKATASTLNLSGYTKISLWFKSEVAVADTDRWTITLCSNNNGTGVVDTFKIPALTAAEWYPLVLTKEGGGALGSSIQSIAINTGTSAPTASKYIEMNNIIATTDSGLNHTSLISKTGTDNGISEGWYPIQSINGTTIVIDGIVDSRSGATTNRGYYGTSGSNIETFFRRPYTVVSEQTTKKSGTYLKPISFYGGYSTATNTRTGETFLDGLNGAFDIVAVDHNFNRFSHISCVRGENGFINTTNYGAYIEHSISSACGQGFYWITGSHNCTADNILAVNCTTPIRFSGSCNHTITNVLGTNNSTNGIVFITASYHNNVYFASGKVSANNRDYGVSFEDVVGNHIYDATLVGNALACTYNTTGKNYFTRTTMTGTETGTPDSFADSRIYSQAHDGSATNHWTFTDGATMNLYSGTNHTAGTSLFWKYDITSANRTAGYPFKELLARLPVKSGQTLTFKCWVKKDHATDVGASIFCRGGQLAGVSDTETTATTSDTDWHELTLTLTPSEAGVLEIEGKGWYVAGNAAVYFDDLTTNWS